MLDLHAFSSLFSFPFQAIQTLLNVAISSIGLFTVTWFATQIMYLAVNDSKTEVIAVDDEVKVDINLPITEAVLTPPVEVLTVSTKLTVKQLKALAKEQGYKGYSKLKKADLLTLLS